MKNYLLILFILTLFQAKIGFAESGKSVFIINTIHEIRLTFEQKNFWDSLVYEYEIKHGEVEGDVTPIIAKMVFDGKELDSIGVKLKANFSYSIPSNKKPLKLDFNAFVKGQRFDGLRTLNLSNEFPDPTFLRNTVAYKILREAGVAAPRTSYAKVYLNDVYWGLYVLIEQVDRAFIRDHFHPKGAELVKANASSLFYQDLDTMNIYSVFEIKVKDEPDSWAHLIDLCRKINKTPAEVFHDSLKNIFDLEGYLKVFAADIIFNNWDSYFYGQNYYLLRDSVESKYYFIPWDYNLSLNIYDISGGDFEIVPGLEEQHIFKLPLPVKVMENPFLRKRYLEEIKNINDLMLAQSDFVSQMHAKLKPALLADSGKVMTMMQYEKCLQSDTELSEIPMRGLLTFIKGRNGRVKAMLGREGVIQK